MNIWSFILLQLLARSREFYTANRTAEMHLPSGLPRTHGNKDSADPTCGLWFTAARHKNYATWETTMYRN
jgi:hypothetical protein